MVREPTRIYGDNQAANKLTKAHFISTGNQYIYTSYFWIQELVKNGNVCVPYVNTKVNISDIHTKSVTTQVIKELVTKACGYEHKWLHDLMLNTNETTTQINPKHKHSSISSYCKIMNNATDFEYKEVDDNGDVT